MNCPRCGMELKANEACANCDEFPRFELRERRVDLLQLRHEERMVSLPFKRRVGQ